MCCLLCHIGFVPTSPNKFQHIHERCVIETLFTTYGGFVLKKNPNVQTSNYMLQLILCDHFIWLEQAFGRLCLFQFFLLFFARKSIKVCQTNFVVENSTAISQKVKLGNMCHRLKYIRAKLTIWLNFPF